MTGTAISPKNNPLSELITSWAKTILNAHITKSDEFGNPKITRFLLERGRLPFVTDDIKPWKYRGWILPYIQLAENIGKIPARYSYLIKTIDRGKILKEPIPQYEFCGEYEPCVRNGMKQLEELLKIIENKSGSWNAFRDLCEWIAFAVGVIPETSKLSEKIQEELYRTFNLEPFLLFPSDYLGQFLAIGRGNGWNPNAFYPTPIHLVELMAKFNAGKTCKPWEKVMDPCVGTGRMLLVYSNYSLRLYGQDIDPLCCLITKINLGLYAPWFYLPDSIFAENEQKDVEIVPESEQITEQHKIFTTEIEQPSLFDL